MRLPAASLLFALLTAMLACPAEIPEQERVAAPKRLPEVGEDDPRVVRDGDDLYPNPERRLPAPEDPAGALEGERPSSRSLGTGVPDESNGECRLFAPKLPNPACCKVETGFDVDTAKQACGHALYLGESFRHSCSYYFHRDDGPPYWFRVSFAPGKTSKAAAESHDRKMKRLTKDPTFASKPFPGVRGVYTSSHEGLNWAYLPGWPEVRVLAWKDGTCPPEGLGKLIRTMVKARKPPRDAPRPGLIPKART
jgi:hypothetical protein